MKPVRSYDITKVV